MTIGEKIEASRKEKGKTLQEVADAVGIGKSTLSLIENDGLKGMVLLLQSIHFGGLFPPSVKH
ncbi:helix-turn-helix transcriptional regulator [uncultured Desulfuromusa sp.]|uniref:helix-turn-helix domain-containing protein n=1 Tax=uncultured Desulfuromusa sp. TaxID=219183 RepID=UPI002AA5F8FA|nr:helix-turn-helix transcriptional regulator [uncultured Desulfuromusa sp.]